MTDQFRSTNDKNVSKPLLLSFRKPHGKVSSCTVSRWIREVMTNAGIDTSIFKGHSARGAATSRAAISGVSSEDIMKMADWSNNNTFKRFYYRPTYSRDFARAVLHTA